MKLISVMNFYLQNKNIQFFWGISNRVMKDIKIQKHEDQFTTKTLAFNLMTAVIKIQFFKYNKKIVSWLLYKQKSNNEDIEADDKFTFVITDWRSDEIFFGGRCSPNSTHAKLGGVMWRWKTKTFMPSTRIFKIWSSSQKWFQRNWNW